MHDGLIGGVIMVTVRHNGHTIQAKMGFFGGEKVFYDGKEVSSKTSALGATHTFSVKEKNKTVQYDVEFGAGFTQRYVIIRKEGKIIFSDK